MMETVAIVGLGLIGGSFARALRSRAGFRGRILGVSRPQYLDDAIARGIVDEGMSLAGAAARADLVYLSSSIGSILEAIACLDGFVRPGTVVTDAGSTKAEIMRRAREHVRGGIFIGGHPMAGKEQRGTSAADADLFDGKPYFLCYADPDHGSLARVVEFRDWIASTGALPVEIHEEEHDRLVALTSHLPQLASTALAATLDRRLGAEQARRACGSGAESMLRLALSGYDGLWKDILDTNQEAVRNALDFYISELKSIRARIGGDLSEEFKRGGEFASTLRNPVE